MYRIYCDDICIYDDRSSEDAVKLVAPTLTWEDNAAGTLTFTMPKCNVGYDKVFLMASEITVTKDTEITSGGYTTEEIWWGRPIKETKDFWNNRAITCEGALAYLNDVIQPQMAYEEDITKSYNDLSVIPTYYTSRINEEELGKPASKSYRVGEYMTFTNQPSDRYFVTTVAVEAGTELIYKENVDDASITPEQATTIISKTFNGYPNSFINDILKNHNAKSKYQFLLGNIDIHAIKTDGSSQTYPVKMVDEDDNDEFYEYIVVRVDNKNTLEVLSEKLFNKDELDVHMFVTKAPQANTFYLHALSEPIEASTQKIEFGKNLLDFTTGFDDSVMCSVLRPRGKSLGEGMVDGLNEYVELTSAQDGERTYTDADHEEPIKLTIAHPYIKNTTSGGGIDVYGWIEKTMDFSDVDDEEELAKKAIDWMVKHRFKDTQLDLKAFDMSYLGVDYSQIRFFQNIHVVSKPHALERDFPVLGISIPLDNPANATYTLGKTKVGSLSTYSSSVQKDVEKQKDISELDYNSLLNSGDDTLYKLALERKRIDKEVIDRQTEIARSIRESKEYAADYVGTATKGRVTLQTSDAGAECLVIADLPENYNVKNYDFENPPAGVANNGQWIWNWNGLAFYPHGIKKWKETHDPTALPPIAITNQGDVRATDISTCTLSADNITAGTIDGAEINVINLKADWITSGTLMANTVGIKSGTNDSGSMWIIQNGAIKGYWNYKDGDNPRTTLRVLSDFHYYGETDEVWDAVNAPNATFNYDWDEGEEMRFGYHYRSGSTDYYYICKFKVKKHINSGTKYQGIIPSTIPWNTTSPYFTLVSYSEANNMGGINIKGDAITFDGKIFVKNDASGSYLSGYTGEIRDDKVEFTDEHTYLVDFKTKQFGISVTDDGETWLTEDGGDHWYQGGRFYFSGLTSYTSLDQKDIRITTGSRQVINGVIT